ncbi:MAG: universal stress protein [Bacteroidales bacterium]|nr:universal stress protein [Bacteroidales bacterium]
MSENFNIKKPVLVTWDYSEKSEYALLHAIDFAKALNREIILAHITKWENDVALNVERLNLKAEDIMSQYGIRPSVIVKTGNIFEEIKSIIQECDAEIAVMGTHGMKGLQKFTGSWALKVIAGSKAPFVVVQDKPTEADIHKIVLPLDFKAEEREKLVWADFINKIFKCKFYLCYTESNDSLIFKRTHANLNAAVKYLESRSINYELQRFDGKTSFATETVKFAESIGSGLIIIMTTKNIRFQDYVFGATEQQIIANEAKIPVMCVNPME